MNARELIKEIESRLNELAKMTEASKSSTEVVSYLRFMAHFHNYSLHNTLSIWLHCPNATRVAGYRTWQKLGRFVKKGEKGIPILAPCPVTKTIVDEDGNEQEVEVLRFKVVYVFDVSQTDGKPLPEAPTAASGDGKGLLRVLERIARDKGITCEYATLKGSHHGTSYGGRIEIDDRLDEAGKVSVMVHELAHELLHRGGEKTTKKQRETEAEATSFVVCSHFGIRTKAPNYLALWSVDPDEIIGAFERIHRVASEIIEAIHAATGKDESSGVVRCKSHEKLLG